MDVFTCQHCEQLVYFENTHCETCGRALGYLPDRGTLSALEPDGDAQAALAAGNAPYRFCANAAQGVCNWMLPADSGESLCAACRHNRVIPDLGVAGNEAAWRKIEMAKHRLFYSLLKLKLPLANRADDPQGGLAFDFLGDAPSSHGQGVMTGHDNGVITLALKEADEATRERIRGDMGEPYRTLLGHFRHEIGHYYWDHLVGRDEARLAAFRALFGDERADYASAVRAHYEQGPPPDWQNSFVSAYATTHPWEDFAETWAHYLHIVDTLESARAFGVRLAVLRPGTARRLTAWRAPRPILSASVDFDPHDAKTMSQLVDAWLPLTFAVNSLNRSMGQPDLYPFVLSPHAIEKLDYVHALTHA